MLVYNRIFITINFLLFIFCGILCESPPKFCDEDYIDAVLWDGIRYRVTRNQWIAAYDEKSGTVGEFVHKNMTGFTKDKEKDWFYRSQYHISEVPKCGNLSKDYCEEMKQLKGLTVSLIQNNVTEEHILSIRRMNGSVEIRLGLKEEVSNRENKSSLFWTQKFLDNTNKYRSAVYSPKHSVICLIWNSINEKTSHIKSDCTHLKVEPNIWKYYELLNTNRVITSSFWSKYEQKLFIVYEELNGNKSRRIAEMYLNENSPQFLISESKSVKTFFGCHEMSPTDSTIESTKWVKWIIIIIIVIAVIPLLVTIIVLIVVFKSKANKTKVDKKTKEMKRLPKMLKKMSEKCQPKEPELEKTPSYHTIGFDPTLATTQNMNKPIPIKPNK